MTTFIQYCLPPNFSRADPLVYRGKPRAMLSVVNELWLVIRNRAISESFDFLLGGR